jgi:Domain of unknown function (DUF6504)
MIEFVSESIIPEGGRFDGAAMARGEPGLPTGFVWREATYTVVATLSQWKESAREGGRGSAELYLRRHCYKLRMSDGSSWSVYFLRQALSSGPSGKRWFLYTIEHDDENSIDPPHGPRSVS